MENSHNSFYHLQIAKCGGTYLNTMIVHQLFNILKNNDISYIDGEYHLGWKKIENNYVISSLRDPVKRTVSHYAYWKNGRQNGLVPENVPNFKIIKSNKGDVFISLKEINEECIEDIEESIRNKMDIEEYLESFIMPTKTNYEKKKPLLIQNESDSEEYKLKPKKKKIIIEETTPVPIEQPIINSAKPSRKIRIKGEPKNKSRRRPDIKKRKLLIVDSSSTEQV